MSDSTQHLVKDSLTRRAADVDIVTVSPWLLIDAGRARLSRRQRMITAAYGSVVLASAVVIVVAVTGGWNLGPTPPPAKPDAATTPADPDAVLGQVQFAGEDRAVATWRLCKAVDEPCRVAVTLTADGWDTSVGRELGRGPDPWVEMLPSGSAAVISADGAKSFILRADGSTTPLTVTSRDIQAAGATYLVSRPPDAPADADNAVIAWAINESKHELGPLAVGFGPATVFEAPQSTPDGVTYVMMWTPMQGGGGEGGQVWRLSDGVLTPAPEAPSLAGLRGYGDVLVGATDARNIAVSTDGQNWREISPGAG